MQIACFLLALTLLPNPSPALDRAPNRGAEQAAQFKAYLGRAALVHEDYRLADRLLTEALASPVMSDTVKAFAYANRGVARTYLNDLRNALDDLNAAVRHMPDEASLYNNRGTLLLRLELYKAAAEDFGTAIALLPSYGEAFNNRGNARFLLGDYRAASEDYSKAIALMPMSAVPLHGRGRAQFALERPGAAMRDFSRTIELDPRYGHAYLHRGEALLALGRYEDAVSDYSQAIDLGLNSAQAYLGRASALAFLGLKEPALADLAVARKRGPAIVEAAAKTVANLHQVLEESEAADLPSPALSPEEPEQICLDDRLSSSKAPLPPVSESKPILVRASLLNPAPQASRASVEDASASSAHRTAFGCTRPNPAAPLALAASAAPDEPADDLSADGWDFEWINGEGHIATNPAYPDLRLRLETYGGGDTELLHWQPLSGDLSSIGLLHYYAGTTLKGVRMEYVAIVDTERGYALAIEPARWGTRQAKWVWRDGELIVLDPQGVPSRVALPTGEALEEEAQPEHLVAWHDAAKDDDATGAGAADASAANADTADETSLIEEIGQELPPLPPRRLKAPKQDADASYPRRARVPPARLRQ